MPYFPHDLKAGVDVVSSDGHKLGQLQRMVLRRGDLSVTHIVIDIGFLRSGHHLWEGGLGLDYDRVVPIGQIHAASDERVELKLTATEFKDTPEYTSESFEAPQDLTPNAFDLPDVVNRLENFAAIINSTSNTWIVEKLNKPLDAVDIKEGTPVWRVEPHENLGDVKRLLLDPASGALRAFVIRRGLIFKHDVILPKRYIAELFDDIVRVDISNEELAQLQEYEEAQQGA
ncbi:MAG TPA: hypothetical protein VFY10_04000 [Dehalococcoidia bacterium]|nr:hypothetical protein [Dehalococcoidia bacterium]